MVLLVAENGIVAIALVVPTPTVATVVPAHCSEAMYLKTLATLLVPPAGSIAINAPAPLVPNSIRPGGVASSNDTSTALVGVGVGGGVTVPELPVTKLRSSK